MKKIVQLVAALTIISAICAAVLALVNSKTKDRIASLTAEKTANAAKAVLPSDVRVMVVFVVSVQAPYRLPVSSPVWLISSRSQEANKAMQAIAAIAR